ncbi:MULTISPECIES: hypothetical protein [Nocardiopsis]|uniref:Uncharacterized protein n=2 Tax=Nocardiopsis TaxID=2013 RepID=D7AWJ1_NOCDD|nr:MULTISPECIES: hypothetical protein [Nocardiopsis]ADH65957.1 hypothetical protein Ndas_0510 [Nocardiopsis dassonvillei subsp. dassonvillei DSM 43111]NKY79862.1 hypothetical protein [Nocardiopsis dassonvillei]QUX28143.1 hypothetical protein KGD83_23215 [Nocardiopsis akebiae]VEI91978.1 Uncharacterised protein [Nocardiopsis dassonvillei]
MFASFGQPGHVTTAIDKELNTLPSELEKLATDGDISELKRVATALNKRFMERQMKEDPRVLVSAIMKAKNGK